MTTKQDPISIKAKLQRVEQSLDRWLPRMTRAANMVADLMRRRRYYQRLLAEAKAAKPVPVKAAIETDHLPEPEFEKLASAMADEANDRLDIRNQGWLSPAGQVTQVAKDELARIKAAEQRDQVAADAIKAQQAERAKTRKKNQAEERKARKAGATRKMPLTGKAALAAIRGSD